MPSGSPIRKGFLVAVTESDTLCHSRDVILRNSALSGILNSRAPRVTPAHTRHWDLGALKGPVFLLFHPQLPLRHLASQPPAGDGQQPPLEKTQKESRLGPLVTAGLRPQLDRFLSAGRVPAGLKCLRKTLTPPGNSSRPLSLVSW